MSDINNFCIICYDENNNNKDEDELLLLKSIFNCNCKTYHTHKKCIIDIMKCPTCRKIMNKNININKINSHNNLTFMEYCINNIFFGLYFHTNYENIIQTNINYQNYLNDVLLLTKFIFFYLIFCIKNQTLILIIYFLFKKYITNIVFFKKTMWFLSIIESFYQLYLLIIIYKNYFTVFHKIIHFLQYFGLIITLLLSLFLTEIIFF